MTRWVCMYRDGKILMTYCQAKRHITEQHAWCDLIYINRIWIHLCKCVENNLEGKMDTEDTAVISGGWDLGWILFSFSYLKVSVGLPFCFGGIFFFFGVILVLFFGVFFFGKNHLLFPESEIKYFHKVLVYVVQMFLRYKTKFCHLQCDQGPRILSKTVLSQLLASLVIQPPP